MLKRIAVFALLGAGLGLSGTAMAKELKLASFVPPAHTMHKALMVPFAEAVAAATNGALTVRIYPGGELGAGPQQQYMRAVQGAADLSFGLQGYTSSQFPRTLMAELPGLGTDPVEMTNRIWNAIELIRDDYKGTVPIAIWTNEPNVVMSREKEVRALDDLKGMKLRVPGAVMARVLERLGATPVPMPATKMYESMQTGVVDGVLTGSTSITGFKISEVAKSFSTGMPFGVATFFLVMNKASYDGLTAAEKAAVDKAGGRDLSLRAAKAYGDAAIAGLEAMKKDGSKTVIAMSDAELAKLKPILEEASLAEIEAAEKAGIPARKILEAMK